MRGTDDPHQVIVLFEAEDLDRAKAFANSDDLRETMMRAGVQDQPDVYYLDGVDA